MNRRTRFKVWMLHRRVDRLQRYVDDWKKETLFAGRAYSHYKLLKAQTLHRLKEIIAKEGAA